MPYAGFDGSHGIHISVENYERADKTECLMVVVNLGGHGIALKNEEVEGAIEKILKTKLHTIVDKDATPKEVFKRATIGWNLYFPTTALTSQRGAFKRAFEAFVAEVAPTFISCSI